MDRAQMSSEMPIHLLAGVPYFAGLAPSRLAELARAARCRRYDAGQLVLLEGEACTGTQIVESGWLRSFRSSPSGRAQTLRVVGPREVFSDLALFAGKPNLVTVAALESSTVWFVPADGVLALLEQPSVAKLVVQSLATRALSLLSLVEDLSLRSVTARLARLLLENASEDIVPRRRWATQGEMANRLGTVPDVLNRALRILVAEGLIAVNCQQIRICDRPGLQTKADGDA